MPCVVCALGSALLSVSGLNCHPGNLRGEPQLGEGLTEPSPSSRASSGPPFSRKSVCCSPHVVVSPLPEASGAHMAPEPPIVSRACCPSHVVCAAPGLPPKALAPCPRPSYQPAQHLHPNTEASSPPGTMGLALRVLLGVLSVCVGVLGAPGELAPCTIGGATHLTPTSSTLLGQCWDGKTFSKPRKK